VRVLHVMPSFWPATRYGGPIESVLRLCQSLVAAGIDLEVVTTDADGPNDLPIELAKPLEQRGVRVRYFSRFPRTRYTISMPLAAHLRRAIKHVDIVHVTALFSFSSEIAEIMASLAGVPYITSPQGTLLPWAFHSKSWKKWPYFHFIAKPCLERAALIHATSDAEADAIKRLAPKTQTFVVPNGVDLPERLPAVPRRRDRIVFLGRIHPVKGFDVLIPALSQIATLMPDVETVIAGPDEEGEWARVAARIERASPRPRVRYLGPVYGQEKLELLTSATVLVLPSHSENFGIVVAEALACGTPVVVSKNCPWKIVEERGAGAWVENTPEQITRALLAILRDEPLARRMSEHGPVIASSFAWEHVARQMIAHYEMITRGVV